jgi:hypothetical protein
MTDQPVDPAKAEALLAVMASVGSASPGDTVT